MDRSQPIACGRGARLLILVLAVLFAASCDDEPTSVAPPPDGDEPVLPPEDTASLTIAFIGDQGWEPADEANGPRAVLQLIRDEGADAVMHQGDFDYGDDPAAWEAMIDDVLGADFPYFVSVGNHDESEWAVQDGYQDRMETRLERLNIPWEGELGERAAVEYRGIYMLFGAPGVLGSDPTVYADYFRDRLDANDAIWSVCSWHKNQREMQVGGKSSETGWEVYESCREGGAIIATGHEHSYSRTHLLSNMESQTVASSSDTLRISAGASFAFVSGLGGRSVRDQERDGDHWAAIYTSDQGANHGALFGRFGVGADPQLAHFYFKDIDGVIADEFWVESQLGSAPAAPTAGIWIGADELMALPTSGTAWESLRAEAERPPGTPDLSDQDDRTNVTVLAKALVAVRTDDAALAQEVRDACLAAMGTEDGGRTLAAGRELAAYVIAADLVGLPDADDAEFRAWLRETLNEDLSGRTLVSTHEDRPNNWGTHAGASRMAAAVYLGDGAELGRAATVFRGWLGDRSAYADFAYADLSWQCDPAAPVGINPTACTRDGHPIGGVIPDDQRRGGDFRWPPPKENYVYEGLQGALVQAVILYRNGYPDVWEWEDRALLRAFRWLHEQADFPAEGDDTWQPHIINRYYGTSFPAPVPANPGKNMGWTDWTHGS